MSKPKKQCWSQSVGVYGSRVRVSELVPGGTLYLLWVGENRKQQKRSLGHRNRKTGKDDALALASRLATDRSSTELSRLTVNKLFEMYERQGLHGRTERHRREVKRKLGLWEQFLGPDRAIETLSPADVDRFVDARRSGKINPAGKRSIRTVEMTTIWHDYVALSTALNFGTHHRDARGKPLLVANPLRGVRVNKTVAPARPVADMEYYEALRASSASLNPMFGMALDLAYATGHRIDAILKLRWEDVTFGAAPNSPLGAIRWRGEHDKIDNDHVVPMNELAREALASAARLRSTIGLGWIFPSPTDATRPLDRHLASRWLRRAEKLAAIEHVRGRGWHSLRRGWASARKHLPDVDVAAAGGWKDTATMKRCYQHADPAGVLRVVREQMRRISG